MPDENPDPRAAVLRAAGHPEAANLLDALARIDHPATSEPDAAEQPPSPTPAWEQQAAAERAGGQQLLDNIHRQFPDRFTA